MSINCVSVQTDMYLASTCLQLIVSFAWGLPETDSLYHLSDTFQCRKAKNSSFLCLLCCRHIKNNIAFFCIKFTKSSARFCKKFIIELKYSFSCVSFSANSLNFCMVKLVLVAISIKQVTSIKQACFEFLKKAIH